MFSSCIVGWLHMILSRTPHLVQECIKRNRSHASCTCWPRSSISIGKSDFIFIYGWNITIYDLNLFYSTSGFSLRIYQSQRAKITKSLGGLKSSAADLSPPQPFLNWAHWEWPIPKENPFIVAVKVLTVVQNRSDAVFIRPTHFAMGPPGSYSHMHGICLNVLCICDRAIDITKFPYDVGYFILGIVHTKYFNIMHIHFKSTKAVLILDNLILTRDIHVQWSLVIVVVIPNLLVSRTPLPCTRMHDRVPLPNGKLRFRAFQRYMTCLCRHIIYLFRHIIYRWKALILTRRDT